VGDVGLNRAGTEETPGPSFEEQSDQELKLLG
jgi:hypothetical protein